MATVEVFAKRWGSSIGIIIPKEIVDQEHIALHEKIRIEIKKTHTAQEVWGLLPKGWKKSTQALKDEAREGWN